MSKVFFFEEQRSTTEVDCKRDGHCLYEATDPNYWWCCKCQQYFKKSGVKYLEWISFNQESSARY